MRNDISKGALYFHFPSKEVLAEAIVQEQSSMWRLAVGNLLGRYSRAIPAMLELSWRAACMCRDDAVVRAGLRLVAERSLSDPSAPHPCAGLAGIVDGLLADARAQHDLLPQVEISNATGFIAAALYGLQHIALTRHARPADNGYTDRPECVTAMWRFLLPGLVTENCMADMAATFTELGRG